MNESMILGRFFSLFQMTQLLWYGDRTSELYKLGWS